ncbi:MAG: DoxX family protein [Mycobacteriales bacterium]
MRATNIGLLLLRLSIGLTLAAHGAQKLFGWFGGHGLAATGAGFEAMGFRPGRPNALAAGLGEAGGGLLIATGLATPLGTAAASATMAVAASTHVPNGFFSSKRGLEFPMTLGVAATAVAFTGPGDLSLDRLLGRRFGSPRLQACALISAWAGAAAIISRRQQVLRRGSESPSADGRKSPGTDSGEPPASTAHPPGATSRSMR